MYFLQCDGCRATAFTETPSDPDSLITCACCPLDHHHGQAANACAGGHGACPDPAGCTLHANVKAHHDPDGDRVMPPDECPGGHCHKDIPECTVCRPITVTFGLPGMTIQPARSEA